MDGSQRPATRKKPDTQGHVSHEALPRKRPEQVNPQAQTLWFPGTVERSNSERLLNEDGLSFGG